jgi:putative ABC transport system permease protein
MKLRTMLTVSGVIISIALFISMVSFGLGIQKNISSEYENLGLFTTMQVYSLEAESDSVEAAILNDEALQNFKNLPGVKFAYPYNTFNVRATLFDSTVTVGSQTIPHTGLSVKAFKELEAGEIFKSDSSKGAIVSQKFLEMYGIENADTVLGQPLAISIRIPSVEKGIQKAVRGIGNPFEFIYSMISDSIDNVNDRNSILEEKAKTSFLNFISGFMEIGEEIVDTVYISGVTDRRLTRNLRLQQLIIPTEIGQRFSRGNLDDNPAEIMMALKNGDLFESEFTQGKTEFSRVTLEISSAANVDALTDTLEVMGYRTHSFAQEFSEIRKIFLILDLILGIVGFASLMVASLGITNTLIMSIVERRHEIGVLKSLGAYELDISFLFLVESSVIGMLGSIIGIGIGKVATIIANKVAISYMINEGASGIEDFNLFDTPWTLILGAFLFGIVVSVIAGAIPAARAAKVDPVEALRSN